MWHQILVRLNWCCHVQLLFWLFALLKDSFGRTDDSSGVSKNYETCWDEFDQNLRRQCMRGEWQSRYYFDHATSTCQLFWYDGCQSEVSRNIFPNLLECQWLCEKHPPNKANACLEPFDQHYRDECEGGKWRKMFYYDKRRRRCATFWYDGCKGTSKNIFDDKTSCENLCSPDNLVFTSSRAPPADQPFSITTTKVPYYPTQRIPSSQIAATARPRTAQAPVLNATSHSTTTSPTKPWKITSTPTTSANICERTNPCKNGGICVFDVRRGTHYCSCAPGFTNDDCGEKIDFDPCSNSPCQNGGSCSAKAEPTGTTFECYCAKGFAGRNCELRPCDSMPCKNGGICRTTRGALLFFCECPPGWGGRTCIIDLSNPDSSNIPNFGSNMELLSSGKSEWIKEMQKMNASTPSASKEASSGPAKMTAKAGILEQSEFEEQDETADRSTTETTSAGDTTSSFMSLLLVSMLIIARYSHSHYLVIA